MKFVLRMDLKNGVIKSDYRRIIISYFKKAISNYYDGKFYDQLYNKGAQKKSLVWSVRLFEPVFKQGIIELGKNKIEMIIRCEEKETALIYFQALLSMVNIPFNIGNDNQLILKSIRKVFDKDIEGHIIGYKILSPLCIRCHSKETNKDWYLTYQDENFQEEIQNKLKGDLPSLTKEIDEMEFDFSNCKKVSVPAFGIIIPSTIGVFYAKGNKQLLNHIKNNGFGSRLNAGFGLIEPIL